MAARGAGEVDGDDVAARGAGGVDGDVVSARGAGAAAVQGTGSVAARGADGDEAARGADEVDEEDVPGARNGGGT